MVKKTMILSAEKKQEPSMIYADAAFRQAESVAARLPAASSNRGKVSCNQAINPYLLYKLPLPVHDTTWRLTLKL
ncbi:hypothetical protein V9K67_09390 [Paraflavisolibacter sp. H34]|uniref:hypothetical protein n=1 Tax=Huijunlia imazamoxiresistens TaxID=3127457 RepID=UPI0030189C6D